jgi:hypothetical protein
MESVCTLPYTKLYGVTILGILLDILLQNQVVAQVTNTQKYGLSPLLHVSARLYHPQGVHTSNLKLAKI